MTMKHAIKYIRSLFFNLRMMGIPLDGFNYGYRYSQKWRTSYISTHVNPTDLFTKDLILGSKRYYFDFMLLHHSTGEKELPIDPATAATALSVAKE